MFVRFLRWVLVASCLMVVASCGNSKFKSYNGPEVTWVVIEKQKRRMYLFHNDKVLKKYKIALGFAPNGHKQFEGDGRTPEGTYLIDRRNPNSDFHLSIGISYPNHRDLSFAQYHGRSPGGDIFIHGQPNNASKRRNRADWTAGCIAVTNEEMQEIYAMVRTGTPITINP